MRENSFVFCSRLCFDTLIIIIKRMNIILPSSHLLHLVLHSTEREVWGHLGNKHAWDLCQSQAPSLTVFSVGCLCGDGTLIGPEEPTLAPLSCLRPAPSPLPEIWPDTCFRVRSFNLFQPQDKKLKCWLFSIFILISPHWFWTKLWISYGESSAKTLWKNELDWCRLTCRDFHKILLREWCKIQKTVYQVIHFFL